MKDTGTRKKKSLNGFAGRLKQLRSAKGLSQGELSKVAGIHYMHLSKYERGVARPSADVLKKIANALGVSSDFLLEGGAEDIAAGQFEDRDFLSLFLEVEKFPEEDRVMVKRFLGALVKEKKLEQLAAK
jgi:transcriptional regulator with XRE-family HTH domain